MQRALVLQFYYDIAAAYKLSEHVPWCAISIWDGYRKGSISHAAAALLIGQKWADTVMFPIRDLSDLFGVPEAKVAAAEVELLETFLSVKTLRRDRVLARRLLCAARTTGSASASFSTCAARCARAVAFGEPGKLLTRIPAPSLTSQNRPTYRWKRKLRPR